MSYIDDKLDIAETKARDRDAVARASLEQLMRRWGYNGPTSANEAKRRDPIAIKSMSSPEEWILDGDQPGTAWKEKMYRRIK